MTLKFISKLCYIPYSIFMTSSISKKNEPMRELLLRPITIVHKSAIGNSDGRLPIFSSKNHYYRISVFFSRFPRTNFLDFQSWFIPPVPFFKIYSPPLLFSLLKNSDFPIFSSIGNGVSDGRFPKFSSENRKFRR
jgi:hypothetical protein